MEQGEIQMYCPKILLTGLPRSGKTTILEKIVAEYDNKRGFLTREALDADGEMKGFNAVDSFNNIITLASIHMVTPHHIKTRSNKKADRYYIDIDTFETFLAPLSDFRPGELLYIDEIGQMEMMSPLFLGLVQAYFDSPNPMIATVSEVYSSPIIDRLKADPKTALFVVDELKREDVEMYARKLLARGF